MANKHNSYLTSIVTKKMQIKTTVESYTYIVMTIRKTEKAKWRHQNSHTLLGTQGSSGQLLWKSVWWCLFKLHIHIAIYYTQIPLLGVFPTEIYKFLPKCPSTVGWINISEFIHTMENATAMKVNDPELHPTI